MIQIQENATGRTCKLEEAVIHVHPQKAEDIKNASLQYEFSEPHWYVLYYSNELERNRKTPIDPARFTVSDSEYMSRAEVEEALMCNVGESEQFIAGIRHVANKLGYFGEEKSWMALGIDMKDLKEPLTPKS